MLRGVRVLMSAAAGACVVCAGAHHARAQSPLHLLDSVRVKETETVFLGRIGTVARGPRGHVWVTDMSEGRVVELNARGDIVRTYGRKGRGPGELESAGSIAFAGDSLMFVMDNGQRRVVVYDVRTGKSPYGFAVNSSNSFLAQSGNEMLVTTVEPTLPTSVVSYSLHGERTGSEGVVPAIAKKFPMLLGAFRQSALATGGRDVFGAYETSQSIYRWTRGSSSATELRLPVATRWGVDDAKFEQMVRDPNAATPALIYHHSWPMALDVVSPDVVALVTLDPTMKPGVQGFSGVYHVTIADFRQKRVCPEIALPIPTDPLPHVTLSRDTVIVVQQDSDRQDQPAAAIRRFVVNVKLCKWVPAL